MSLRLSHLAILLAISIVAAAVGGVVATWRVADAEFRDVLDEDLENQSELLAELLAIDSVDLRGEELEDLLEEAFEPEGEETLWVTVHDIRTGRAVSNLSRAMPLENRERETVHGTYRDHDWHGYQSDEGGIVVQMLRRGDLYRDVQAQVLEDIVTPTAVAGAASLVLLALLIALSLWPLTRLVRQLETRSGDSLEPLTLRTPAREMRVLRDALNDLMRGVADTLSRERQFASDVAHELRTPLTTLKLELAGAEPDLRACKVEIDRLSRVVEQLLTLARLEQGKWKQHFAALSLDELVTREVERYRERFREAGMSIEASAAAVMTSAGDPTLLQILVRNLLDNVLEHCPEGTHVQVALYEAEGKIRLEVSDTGPGIDEDRRRRMAEGFTRLDSRTAGLGVGLTICRRIAEVHGASLSFETRHDGSRGLRVLVTFPA